jgi:hypothetical protein
MEVSFYSIEVTLDDFGPGLRALEVACGRRGVGGTGENDDGGGGGAAPAAQPASAFSFLGSVTLWDRPGALDATERARRAEFDTQQSARRSFARFVTLLERFGRERIPTPTVAFRSIRFDEPGFHDADQARLFGEVLPKLFILERVRFFDCSLPVEHLNTFVSKVSSTSSKLFALEMDGCRGDVAACVPALAAMLRRNAPVQILELNSVTGLDRNACRRVFESMQDNTRLWSLEVGIDAVHDDALILSTNKASALRRLTIDV